MTSEIELSDTEIDELVAAGEYTLSGPVSEWRRA